MNNSTEHSLSKIFTASFNSSSPSQILHGLLNSKICLTELFSLIFNRINPLFLVDCCVILIYDEQLTVIREAFISTYLSNTEQVEIQTISKPSELSVVQKKIADFSFPILKTATDWMEEENVNHSLINDANHYQYHCYIPLELDNRIIGTLELHNETRELSQESLTFCSNIADLISQIIYHQLNQRTIEPDIKNSNVNPIAEKSNDHLKDSNQPEELMRLKESINAIDQITQLESFFDECAKLFPSAFGKLKPQLDEIKTVQTKLTDASLHTIEDVHPTSDYPSIVGAGQGMKKVFALMDQVAGSTSTVLILGETGTGKELIARAIHDSSARKDKTMIMVNCAAIPPNLIESELFGHEKGAFTGATDKRIGKFELAEGGTLFLDEIGEMPLDLQVKLLRALQEKEIERVGGKSVIKTDVRLISATNRDLLLEVQKGRFRRDLYFRLNVFPIVLPALRDRTEDIPLLAMHFLTKYATKAGKHVTGFSKAAIRQMQEYSWPGNIREMEHLIERQVLLSKKTTITDLEILIKDKTIKDKDGVQVKIKTIDENERDHIFNVLQICKGRISGEHGAARLLGVPATTLNSKIKRLGLNKKHF